MSYDIQFFDEFHGFKIFIAPMLVRYPFPIFSGIVQIQHRGHRIHTQAINVISIKPTEGTIDEKVFDFRPKAIIDQLNLKRPVYLKTAAYGHFGRDDPDFTWENTDKVDELKGALE